MTTIEMLREKVDHLQRELDEVHAELDKLEDRGTGSADKDVVRSAFEGLMAQMGAPFPAPIGVEALHEMMRREGVEPEACIGSRGIIEMRDE